MMSTAASAAASVGTYVKSSFTVAGLGSREYSPSVLAAVRAAIVGHLGARGVVIEGDDVFVLGLSETTASGRLLPVRAAECGSRIRRERACVFVRVCVCAPADHVAVLRAGWVCAQAGSSASVEYAVNADAAGSSAVSGALSYVTCRGPALKLSCMRALTPPFRRILQR